MLFFSKIKDELREPISQKLLKDIYLEYQRVMMVRACTHYLRKRRGNGGIDSYAAATANMSVGGSQQAHSMMAKPHGRASLLGSQELRSSVVFVLLSLIPGTPSIAGPLY